MEIPVLLLKIESHFPIDDDLLLANNVDLLAFFYQAYGESSFQDCKKASEEAMGIIIKNLQVLSFSFPNKISILWVNIVNLRL